MIPALLRRRGLGLAAALLAAGACATGSRLPRDAPRAATVTLVHLNDVYQISPVDGGRRGGLARVATLVERIEQESPHAIFMIAGDFLAPSVLSTRYKGAQMVDVLQEAGLDVATLGNHEFDFGLDVLRERVAESRFAWTVANVVDPAGTPVAGTHRDLIIDAGGVKVGIVGLLLAETAALARAGNLSFTDPIAAGREAAQRLRAQGADVVVGLTHQTLLADLRLAAEADFDVVIGGHDHERSSQVVGDTPVLKLDADARQLGRVDLRLERTSSPRWRIAAKEYRALEVDDSIPDDPQVAAIVKRYEDELGASLAETIGETEVPLDARASTNRAQETNLGSFLADVFREALGAELAIVNSGGIRSDTVYAAGPITRRDVLAVLPYDNTLVKVKVTGAHLRRLLENGVSLVEHGEGRFLQVSGLRFRFDPERPASARLVRLLVDDRPVQDDAWYTLAVSQYLFGGGDGFDFAGAEMLESDGPMESVVVMEAIRRRGRIAPREEGRILVGARTGG